ncbi:msf1p [Saccharomyces arboricola H-6]|uniref:Phenylalanine--tRNA ligase, mitochondrial n=1 Tax=Saccharomyces arboricola (strain H-6 / AS 2.3317 / CBS 10644) TaxID=1160507 RepID=J8LH16_SACAR|nr:msf1p [Saccharomyces arboricola H-6]
MFPNSIVKTRTGLYRLYSTLKAQHIEINGTKYKTNPKITNVTDSIIKLTDKSLHLKESHPVGILRDLIEKKLNSVDNSYKTFNNFKPVVTTMENFDSLGFPKDHPGRSKSDTYYVNDTHLLRTHTSAHELECFQRIKDSVDSIKSGFLISADVYRRDEIDRTHYPVFHQMEGATIWKRTKANEGTEEPAYIAQIRNDIKLVEEQLNKENVRIAVCDDTISLKEDNPKQEYMSDLEVDLCSQHLKRSIELVVSEVFNEKISSMIANKANDIPKELKVRWINAYFPWTAPSWEIEVWWQGEWLELCGCGLIRQDVLLKAGYKPSETVGWAFGLGLDRIAMLLFEIPDIRLLWSSDERFSKQFSKGSISSFKPYSKHPGSFRDVAFWLPNDKPDAHQVHENDLMEIIRNIAGDLVESVKLVDNFTHPKTGRKSMCYRINYQSMDRNLTNAEVNALQDTVCSKLVKEYDVELR